MGAESQFFFDPFGPTNAQKSIFWQGFETIGTHSNGFGAPGAQRGPCAPQKGPFGPKSIAMGADNFKSLPENLLFVILGSKITKKIGIQAPGPHGEIRAGILFRIPGLKSQMVGWRPIWWQKGVTWGPLGSPRGPIGPPWAQGAPNPLLWVPIISKPCQRIDFWAFSGPK